MKALLPIGLGACLTIFNLQSATAATLRNGNFESWKFRGWTLTLDQGTSATEPFSLTAGTARTTASLREGIAPAPPTLPEGRTRFAVLRTRDHADFIGDGSYDISLSQILQLNQGDTVSGWSSFYNGDLEPQDSAWVRILDQQGNQIASPWQAISGGSGVTDPNVTPHLTTTEWTRWEWQAPDTGSYSLWLGMTTSGDNNSASFSFFDAISVQPGVIVPEPSSLALAVTGTILFATLRRKKS